MSKLHRMVRVTYVETVGGVSVVKRVEGVVVDDMGATVRVKISVPPPHSTKIIEVPSQDAQLRFPKATATG